MSWWNLDHQFCWLSSIIKKKLSDFQCGSFLQNSKVNCAKTIYREKKFLLWCWGSIILKSLWTLQWKLFIVCPGYRRIDLYKKSVDNRFIFHFSYQCTCLNVCRSVYQHEGIVFIFLHNLDLDVVKKVVFMSHFIEWGVARVLRKKRSRRFRLWRVKHVWT